MAVTQTGFELKDLNTIKEELNEDSRTIFGENLNLDDESPDGQDNSIRAEQLYNHYMIAQECYDSFRPSNVTGANMDSLFKLNGLVRIPASPSIVELSITGIDGTIIPAGSEISTDDDITFATIEDVQISGGTATVNASSVENGVIYAVAGTLVNIDNPVSGWSTVTNIEDATLGQDEETDTEFRARRERSVAIDATAVIDSMEANIDTIAGIIDSTIIENDTAGNVNGQDPYSTWAIVNGGTDIDVATAIYQKKCIGIPTFGSESQIVYDIKGNPHTINFDRPTEVEIYVSVTGTVYDLNVFPSDGEQLIKDAIIEYTMNTQSSRQGIGDDVYWSRMFVPANAVAGYTINDLFIDIIPNPSSTSDITIDVNELAVFLDANITVDIS